MNNKDGFTCRVKNLELLSHRSNLKRVYIFKAVGFYHQPCSANETARLTEDSPRLISAVIACNPCSNCEFAYLNSVLRWKFQCAIYHGTLFLFNTPIQSYHRFLRKNFIVEKFVGLSFTQVLWEWKSIGSIKTNLWMSSKRKFWSNFTQNSLLYRTRKGCVLGYMPITKDKAIEFLCNVKVCFTKVKLIFHG